MRAARRFICFPLSFQEAEWGQEEGTEMALSEAEQCIRRKEPGKWCCNINWWRRAPLNAGSVGFASQRTGCQSCQRRAGWAPDLVCQPVKKRTGKGDPLTLRSTLCQSMASLQGHRQDDTDNTHKTLTVQHQVLVEPPRIWLKDVKPPSEVCSTNNFIKWCKAVSENRDFENLKLFSRLKY